MTNVLEVKNVSKKIKKRIIIDDVSFSVKKGEIFGFVGPNGAGKTTLIKIMLGLYKMDSGEVFINGFNLKNDFEKAMENVSAIIEEPAMYDYMSGIDNLRICQRAYNISDDDYLREVIKMVKLGNRINSKVRTYSLGMRQRLGISAALVSKPKVLILDEPTNGLDPLGIKELRELLKRLSKDYGISVFISSHILSEIELISDRVAIIDGGKIIDIKSTCDKNKSNNDEEIFKYFIEVDDKERAISLLKSNGYEVSDELVLNINKDSASFVNELLIKDGIKVYEIRKEIKSLEDEFLMKTKGVL
ncbi:MAG: ABC transporter ATP-binding protein [bacterium]|nr:ABC transporter ATP-binding protein [bacterium]